MIIMKKLLFLFVLLSFLLVAGCAAKEKPSPVPEPVPSPQPGPQPTPTQAPQPQAQPVEKNTGKLLVAITDNPIEVDKANCDFELKKFEVELEGLELKMLNGSWLEIPFLNLTNETNETMNITIDLVETIGIDSLVSEQVIEIGQFNEVRFKVQRAVMTQVIKIPMNLTNLTAFGNLTANLTINETEEFEKDLEIAEKRKKKEFKELEKLLEEKEKKEEEREELRKKLEEEGVEVQQEVKIPSNEIKLKHELEIEKDDNEVLELDFDLRGSFRCAGDKFIFLPVLDLESIDDADVKVKFKQEFEERDGERRVRIKRELEIKDGEIELKTRHRMREFGLTELTNRIEVRQRAEELKKRGLESEKEIEIEVDEGKAKIELEIAGKKQKFKLDTNNLEEAIAEVARITGLNETEVIRLAEIKIEGRKQEEKEAEIEIENGKAEVKIKIKGIETKFELDNTDLDKTIAEITEKTGLTREEVLAIAKIKVEKEKGIEKEESKSGENGKESEKKEGKDKDGKDKNGKDDEKSESSDSSSSGSSSSGSSESRDHD